MIAEFCASSFFAASFAISDESTFSRGEAGGAAVHECVQVKAHKNADHAHITHHT